MGSWALTTPILKSSLGEMVVTGHVMTLKIHPRKAVMNVLLMFSLSFLSL